MGRWPESCDVGAIGRCCLFASFITIGSQYMNASSAMALVSATVAAG
jgi:hypothetical protein